MDVDGERAAQRRWPAARSQSLAQTSAQARRRGGPLRFIHARGGVNVGIKTPILLIVGAFRGGGGAGRWGCPSAVALTCRFSRQEIDVIGAHTLSFAVDHI